MSGQKTLLNLLKLLLGGGRIAGQMQTESEKVVVDQKGEKDVGANIERIVVIELVDIVDLRCGFRGAAT